MKRKITGLTVVTLLIFTLVIAEILPTATLEEIEPIRTVIDAKYIGIRRFSLTHGWLYLTSKNFFDLFVVLFKLDDRQ